jgi:hypothetical protein
VPPSRVSHSTISMSRLARQLEGVLVAWAVDSTVAVVVLRRVLVASTRVLVASRVLVACRVFVASGSWVGVRVRCLSGPDNDAAEALLPPPDAPEPKLIAPVASSSTIRVIKTRSRYRLAFISE